MAREHFTWAEIKAAVEAEGVTDDTPVLMIDYTSADTRLRRKLLVRVRGPEPVVIEIDDVGEAS